MTSYPEFTLAAIQHPPVFFDRDASTEKACKLIEDAANLGATFAVFGETWLHGYPFFASESESPLFAQMSAAYLANGVEVPGPTTDKLCAAARKAGIDVAIGIVELDSKTRGTAYCTLLFIGKEGIILGKHRKLKPTRAERIMWGEGDASSLRVYERPYGKLSGMICWEHNMLLPGYTLISQGAQIHAAAWYGNAASRQIFLSQAFASQAAAYVIAAGNTWTLEDIPEPYRELGYPQPGDSVIIDPRGTVIAGPVQGETILTAKGSLEAVYAAKAATDTAGHYSRPDIFQLHVRQPLGDRVVFHNE